MSAPSIGSNSGEGRHKGHHHYIDGSLVADVEGNKVRLSANGDVAVTMEQEALQHLEALWEVGSTSGYHR